MTGIVQADIGDPQLLPGAAPMLGGGAGLEVASIGLRGDEVLRLLRTAASRGRSGRRALGCTTTAPGLAPGTLPRGGPGSSGYFLAMNVYLPLSSDSLSSQMTVHLPSPLNFAFTAPFFVSYTAHTSSLLLDTDHS